MASIEDQIKEAEKLAQELGLYIVEVIEEKGSAKAPGRKLFNQMLQGIEEGKANGILCWKLNRLARNPVDGGRISWMLQQNLIKHIQCYGRDYKPSDNVLMMQVEFGMANQYVKDLSVDVKRGTRNKAQRGWYPASCLPLGYKHNKSSEGQVLHDEIIPDEQTFPIVQKLWSLMLTGNYSVADIQREGTQLGLLGSTKGGHAYNTYLRMFSNRFYCGEFLWKDNNGNRTIYQGKHKPMVSKLEYERVQEILSLRSNNGRSRNYDYIFKGLLSCGECSAAITAERKRHIRCRGCKKKFSCLHANTCPRCNRQIKTQDHKRIVDILYYRCTKKKGKCSQKYVTESKLKELYCKAINDMELSEKIYLFLVDQLKELEHDSSNQQKKLHDLHYGQKVELEKRLKRLALMRADDEISKDEFNSIKAETQMQIQATEVEIRKLNYQEINWPEIAKGYLDVAKNARIIIQKGDKHEVKRLVSHLGSNHVLKDQKLLFLKAKPVMAIEKAKREYSKETSRLEPENYLISQRDFTGFSS